MSYRKLARRFRCIVRSADPVRGKSQGRRRADVHLKTVYSVSGISKGHYRKGCAGTRLEWPLRRVRPPSCALSAVAAGRRRSHPRPGKSCASPPAWGTQPRRCYRRKNPKIKRAHRPGNPDRERVTAFLSAFFRYGKRFEGLGHFVLNCVFRGNPTTNSKVIRPGIPIESDQSFQSYPTNFQEIPESMVGLVGMSGRNSRNTLLERKSVGQLS